MNVFYKLISLILIVSSFSCGTTKLTNYGRPLNFLSNHRVPRVGSKIQKGISITASKEQQLAIKKPNNNHVLTSVKEAQYFLEKQNKLADIDIQKHHSFVSHFEDKGFVKRPEKSTTQVVTNKIENLINANKFSNKFNTSSSEGLSPINFLNDDISDLVLLLICLLFPPVAVWWRYEFGNQFWIDILLYAPMVFFSSASFAILPMLYAIYVCFLKKKGNTGDVRSSW
jgi:uncharacterized membrane protein YqaE (UPF0057 family)